MTAPALAPALPFEHRPDRPVPDILELCARCLRGVLHRRTPDSPYCPVCGSEQAGIRYVRDRIGDSLLPVPKRSRCSATAQACP